jgi:hypothetical protein
MRMFTEAELTYLRTERLLGRSGSSGPLVALATRPAAPQPCGW